MNTPNFDQIAQMPAQEATGVRAELLQDCIIGTAAVLDFIDRVTAPKTVLWSHDPACGFRGSFTDDRPRIEMTAKGTEWWANDGELDSLCPLAVGAELDNTDLDDTEVGTEAHRKPLDTAWQRFRQARQARGEEVPEQNKCIDEVGWMLLACVSDNANVNDWLNTEIGPEMTSLYREAIKHTEETIRTWLLHRLNIHAMKRPDHEKQQTLLTIETQEWELPATDPTNPEQRTPTVHVRAIATIETPASRFTTTVTSHGTTVPAEGDHEAEDAAATLECNRMSAYLGRLGLDKEQITRAAGRAPNSSLEHAPDRGH